MYTATSSLVRIGSLRFQFTTERIFADMYTQSSLKLALTFAAGAVILATPAFAFQIQAVYDDSINNDANGAAIKNNIASVISFYESRFTDNMTAKIYFRKGGGLGSSEWGYYWNNSGVAVNAMQSDAKTADDAIAVSHLGSQGFGSVAYTSANGRALGLGTGGFLSYNGEGGFDGAVSLNTDICFTDHNSPTGGLFDLYAVAAHEIDEVLGTPSGASGALAFTTDLYRYDGNGNRSFNGDTNSHAYFSIDGTTNIVEYNQFQRSGGDWGDWAVHNPSMVQDYALFSGIKIDMGEPEMRLLDVIGYDRAPVPEPCSLLLVGIGAAFVTRRRRRNL